MTSISVLVLTSSPVVRSRIGKLIADLPDLNVLAVTSNVSEAFMAAEAGEPDLVIVSEEFRTLGEFSALKSLFYVLDARWIFVTSGSERWPEQQLSTISGRMISEPVLDFSMSPGVVMATLRQAMSITRNLTQKAPSQRRAEPRTVFDRLVVIGSSTGGVDALLTVLSEFPEDCPPTAIVQHTGKGFSDSLIRLLERRCKPHVVAAEDGLTLTQGMICVAAGSPGHLTLAPGKTPRCQIRPGAPVSGHVPSVDALFRSAVPMAPQVVGVILTGMGQDGAAGLLDLRRAGAFTIGQDEASSVVYGMPRAAWEMGAVKSCLPLHRIGSEILKASMAQTQTHQAAPHSMVAR
jgi:two-component system chemotaxis response regulator CheB